MKNMAGIGYKLYRLNFNIQILGNLGKINTLGKILNLCKLIRFT